MARRNDDFRSLLETQALAVQKRSSEQAQITPSPAKKKRKKEDEFFGKDADADEMKTKLQNFVTHEARLDDMRKKNLEQNHGRKKAKGGEDVEYEEKVIYKKGKKHVIRKRIGPRTTQGDDDDTARSRKYIDRAAMRRNAAGATEEYERMKAMTAEESRYLGGDLSHTQWVKGLDFKLLTKIRSEQGLPVSLAERSDEEEASGFSAAPESLDMASKRLQEAVQAQWEAWNGTKASKSLPFLSRERPMLIEPANITYVVDISSASTNASSVPEMIIGTSTHRREYNLDREQKLRKLNNDRAGGVIGATSLVSIHPKIIDDLHEVLQWHREERRKPIETRERFRPGCLDPNALFGIMSGNTHAAVLEREKIKSDSEDLDMFGGSDDE